MKNINENVKTRISNRIAEVERNCESELVCLITTRSARYILFPLLIAAMVALFMPIIGVFIEGAITFQHQTILFVILAALFVFTPLNLKLTPEWLKQQNCDRYSVEQFFRQKLHETTSRNAILIFVSWEEKFVTVVADKGIDEKVQQGDWDKLIDDFIGDIKQNEMERGFLQIISAAGDLLATNFPVTTAKTDELPNHLIEQNGSGYVS